MKTTQAPEQAAGAAQQWKLDSIHNKEGDFLFYNGGESGIYLSVAGGVVTVGEYEMAFDHIGNAFFTPSYCRVFPSAEEAHAELFWEDDEIEELIQSAERFAAGALATGSQIYKDARAA